MNAAEYTQEGSFKLMTSFPKKIFTADDFEKPLELLGKYYYLRIHRSQNEMGKKTKLRWYYEPFNMFILKCYLINYKFFLLYLFQDWYHQQ